MDDFSNALVRLQLLHALGRRAGSFGIIWANGFWFTFDIDHASVELLAITQTK
jgi:hypothetical protein